MLEYLPWAQTTFDYALKKYINNELSILDIELGGECNYHCVYCDSPERKKKCKLSIDNFERIISSGMFDWLFICGLGEPTYNDNYDYLIKMLELCRQHSVKCSIFSNISNLSPQLIDFVQSGTLYVLFKYDSPSIKTINTLYGINNAEQQFERIKTLSKYVHFKDNKTNIAASIVPTRLNYDDIMTVIKECISLNIFPLLGELELSGKGEINYENLYLSPEELQKIKDSTEELLGCRYTIPICPAVISGIHISYDSYITVDRFSGLSCHWFWLENHDTYRIKKFDSAVSLQEIKEQIFLYRDKRIPYVEGYLKQKKDIGSAFGGCGGKINTIFRQYIDFHQRRKNDLL